MSEEERDTRANLGARETSRSEEKRSSDIRELIGRAHPLRTFSPFSQLSDEALQHLESEATVREIPEGTQIITQGQHGSSLFVLERGAVEVSLDHPGHSPLVLCNMRGPCFIGEMSLVDDQPRSATVTAIEACSVIEIPRQVVIDYTPPKVWSEILREVSARVRLSDDKIIETWDKLHAAAKESVHAAASVELARVSDLYVRTERLAREMSTNATTEKKDTLERAEQAVRRSEQQAQRARDYVDHHVSFQKTAIALVGGLFSLLTGSLALAGYKEIGDVKDIIDGAEETQIKVVEIRDDLTRVFTDTELKANEFELELYKTRTWGGMANLGLARDLVGREKRLEPDEHEPSETLAQLEMEALYLARIRHEIVSDYISDPTRPPLLKIEAIETFLKLRGLDAPYLTSDEKRSLNRKLAKALVSALAGLDMDPDTYERSYLLEDLLQDRVLRIAEQIEVGSWFNERLLRILVDEMRVSPVAKNLAALVLAQRKADEGARAETRLKKMMSEDKRWSAARAGYGLARLHAAAGWNDLMRRLQATPEPDEADPGSYAAAIVLAREPEVLWGNLTEHFSETPRCQVYQRILRAICSHPPRSNAEEQYIRILTTRLSESYPGESISQTSLDQACNPDEALTCFPATVNVDDG